MGLLTEGKLLTWEETRDKADHVREHGVQQFINQFKKLQHLTKTTFYWGDEVEYTLVKINEEQQHGRLLLKADDILKTLHQEEIESCSCASYRPEFVGHIIEGSPRQPYGGTMADLGLVEQNMKQRREELNGILGKHETTLTITAFPRLGSKIFTEPHHEAEPDTGVTRSVFLPDAAFSYYNQKFKANIENIRKRRGKKVAVNIPIFKDVSTPTPFIENLDDVDKSGFATKAALPDHVYLDCLGFGTASCCIQVTQQATDINEGRLLYDQLAVFCPIMLALSAATPICRGYLTDTDNRWMMMTQAFDDRTEEELGLTPKNGSVRKGGCVEINGHCGINGEAINGSGKINGDVINGSGKVNGDAINGRGGINGCLGKVGDGDINGGINGDVETVGSIPRSRYESIASYISPAGRQYNDVPPFHLKHIYNKLQSAGVDDLLSRYVASLFTRDPLYVFKESLQQNDEQGTDHWENIHSSNWQSMKFKIPASDGSIGWRVEFRPMDVQLTDFENAAYSTFIVLLSRVLLSRKLNFIIPISQLDANMKTAQTRDAVLTGKFHFRNDIFTVPQADMNGDIISECNGDIMKDCNGDIMKDCNGDITKDCNANKRNIEDESTLLSIDEIFHGKGDNPGVIPMIKQYLVDSGCDVETHNKLLQYIDFISKRATGELNTTARWMREFVAAHPDYQQDSRVSDSVCFNLLQQCEHVTNGGIDVMDFFRSRSAVI